jgi:hypothetical protein
MSAIVASSRSVRRSTPSISSPIVGDFGVIVMALVRSVTVTMVPRSQRSPGNRCCRSVSDRSDRVAESCDGKQ